MKAIFSLRYAGLLPKGEDKSCRSIGWLKKYRMVEEDVTRVAEAVFSSSFVNTSTLAIEIQMLEASGDFSVRRPLITIFQ